MIFEIWCDKRTGYPCCMSTPEGVANMQSTEPAQDWEHMYHRCDVDYETFEEAMVYYDSLWEAEPQEYFVEEFSEPET